MKKNLNRKNEANVVQVIRQGYEGLSETYKKIAEFIANNLETATFASLDELSKQIGVSDATLIRFARELGFDGYQGLRAALVDYIREIIYPPDKTAGSLKQRKIPTLEAVRESDIESINRTIQGVDGESFDQMIRLILSSKQIFTLGWGLSSFLAEFLAFQFQRIDLDAWAITRERRPLIERMLFLKNTDLLIVFDLVEYSTEVLEAVEYLHAHNDQVKLVTVTTDQTADIVRYADLRFFCDTLSLLVSLTAPMCLINAMVQEIIARRPQKTRQAVEKFRGAVLTNVRHYCPFGRNSLW